MNNLLIINVIMIYQNIFDNEDKSYIFQNDLDSNINSHYDVFPESNSPIIFWIIIIMYLIY